MDWIRSRDRRTDIGSWCAPGRRCSWPGLAGQWFRGAVKAVPPRPQIDAGFLRCWALAAGGQDDAGYRLGLDPHAPGTYDPLAAALAGAGLAGSFLGSRGGGPAVRIVGHKRLVRLTDLLGTPPAGAPTAAFPDPFRAGFARTARAGGEQRAVSPALRR